MCPLLADYFLWRFVRETGRKLRGFTPAAMKKMEAYSWPGNVRELRNVVERAVALGQGPELDAADIWLSSLEARTRADGGKCSGELRAGKPGCAGERTHPPNARAHGLE